MLWFCVVISRSVAPLFLWFVVQFLLICRNPTSGLDYKLTSLFKEMHLTVAELVMCLKLVDVADM